MGIRDKVLAIEDRSLVAVEVPEWEETVYVKSPTTREFHKVTELMRKNDELYLAKVACLVALDKDGNRLFLDSDMEALASKSHIPLRRILIGFLKFVNDSNLASEEVEKKIQGEQKSSV